MVCRAKKTQNAIFVLDRNCVHKASDCHCLRKEYVCLYGNRLMLILCTYKFCSDVNSFINIAIVLISCIISTQKCDGFYDCQQARRKQ